MHSVVKIQSGEVRGRRSGGVTSFFGVPYAAAPYGENRFRPPAPVPPWDGVRDALQHGPTAPAPGYRAPFDALLPTVTVPGEECLHVNVWTPDPQAARSDVAGRPVMVWVHGGAFVNGSNAIGTYDGTAFARDGVVLVAVNYRLGAEGFALLPDAVPNLGLLDQIAALTWVRDNVGAFGGDPANVTVFGESAGAMSVGALLAMPSARGLFRRAILQSGAAHHTLTPGTAAKVAGHVAAEVGVEPTAAALADVPPARLVAAQQVLAAELATRPDPARWGEVTANMMMYEPVVDGEVLPIAPIDAVAAGASADVDIMAGWNRDEHRFFLVPPGTADLITEPVLDAFAAAYRLPPGALDRYRGEGSTPGTVLADVMTDWFFRIPAIRLAEAHGRAHLYEFDQVSPVLPGLGACHAAEMGFVFDTLAASSGLAGDTPPQALADEMHAAWVTFATTGDPGWERYGAARRVRRFGEVVETLDDPRPDTRELWAGIR